MENRTGHFACRALRLPLSACSRSLRSLTTVNKHIFKGMKAGRCPWKHLTRSHKPGISEKEREQRLNFAKQLPKNFAANVHLIMDNFEVGIPIHSKARSNADMQTGAAEKFCVWRGPSAHLIQYSSRPALPGVLSIEWSLHSVSRFVQQRVVRVAGGVNRFHAVLAARQKEKPSPPLAAGGAARWEVLDGPEGEARPAERHVAQEVRGKEFSVQR